MEMKELGNPIAGNGNLFAWGEDQVIKLYSPETPDDWIRDLGQMERVLYDAGLPVPEVGDLVEVDGQLGQIYERIEGPTLAEALFGQSEQDPKSVRHLAHRFAEIHASIHAVGFIPGLSRQREIFPTLIDRAPSLNSEDKEATREAFNELPTGHQLCHGDFHPFNVILSPRRAVVIDWNNAHLGNPLEDVARSTLMLTGAPISEDIDATGIESFNEAYLKCYFEIRPDGEEQLQAWRPIVAAVRLNDNIPALTNWLLEQVRSGLPPRS